MKRFVKVVAVASLILSVSACSNTNMTRNDSNTLNYTGSYEELLFTRCSFETPAASILPVGDVHCDDNKQCSMVFKKLAVDVFHCSQENQA